VTIPSGTRIWALAVSVSLGVLGASQLFAAPQSARGLEKGKGHDKRYYDQGFRDVQDDAANRRSHRFHARPNRDAGHSFRPTEGDNYRHADRGYSSQLGSRDAYKQEYRQAYVRAYQQGYGR